MPIYPVPYTQFNTPPSPAFPEGRIAYRPLLLLTLASGQTHLSCYAIVDSGADFCLFPLSFALALGLDPLTGTLDGSAGLGTYNIPTYFWTIGLSIQRIVSYDVHCGFTSGLEDWGLGLLGQSGFFDRFKILFDHQNGLYHLEIP